MGRVVIEGMKDLEKRLKELPEKVSRKIARNAMVVASQPMLHDVRSHAPFLTGLLVSTLIVNTRKRKNGFTARIQTKSGDYAGHEFYASFLEYGTSHQPAQPFMRPAFDRNVGQAVTIATEELRNGILKLSAKAARRLNKIKA